MKHAKSKKSNVRNILISFVVIVFFLSVIGIYYAMIYAERKSKIVKSGEISSVSSAAQIDKYLAAGSETLELVCYTLDNMLRTGRTQEEILDYLVNQTIAVCNTNSANTTGIYGYIRGEYLDGSGWVPEADYVPTERPWYIDARAHVGRVAVVDPYVDAMTGSVIVTFCKTLCDAKSVISMDFSMEHLQVIAEDIIENSDSDMEIVLDQNYRVIAHSDAAEVGKCYSAETDTFGKVLVETLRTTESSYFLLEYAGSDYMVYASTVANDWYCLSVFDATRAFSLLWQILLFTVTISIAVVMILLLIMVRANHKDEDLNRLSNVVGALAASIDAKDTYTNGHSGRVAEYAREISKRHGDLEKVQDEIYMMGLLHDVGKIGVPDTVINKPGKLTDEEFELIKAHPEIGSRILSKATGMTSVIDGVRWHHEKYDGSGYPDGLAGKQIPEKARIIAVADAYDAMTSRRSYRDALPQDIVRREIEKGRGTQFDPEFADIMLRMIDDDKDYQMNGREV